MFRTSASSCRAAVGGALSVTGLAAVGCASAAEQRTTSQACNRFTSYASRRIMEKSTAYQRQFYSAASLRPTTTTIMTKNNNVFFLKQQQMAMKLSTDTASKKLSGFELYEYYLQSNPVPTKMVTGCFLWSIGDAVAQLMPVYAYGEQLNDGNGYDYARTGRAALFGFALHAPTSHVHFNFLEWMTHRSGITGNVQVPLFKAFMEQFVYWSWVSNSMYHGAMGAMQGQTMDQIYHRIADNLWETQKAQWVFWIPIQLLNFRFVPVRHQLNVVLVTSIVWTALLSAWYPPEKEEKTTVEAETKEVATN